MPEVFCDTSPLQYLHQIGHFLARRIAESLGLPVTGTLGVLLEAKRAGLVPAIRPLLDHLRELRFRVGEQTRAAVLKKAAELA